MKWPETFERIPTIIQAMRWTGDNFSDLKAWGAPVTFMGERDGFDESHDADLWLWVEANKGQLRLELGEWIAKDHLGYYPVKDNGHGCPTNYQRMSQNQHA